MVKVSNDSIIAKIVLQITLQFIQFFFVRLKSHFLFTNFDTINP